MSAPSAGTPEELHYLDHEPAAWFLVGAGDVLYLDARYSFSALIDTSALISLADEEVAGYRAGGHGYLSELAQRVHMSAPYLPESPYYARDLFRGPDAETYRALVSAAIREHTWAAAQQRRRDGAPE